MNDARARLRYLNETIDLLFPGPGAPKPYTLLPHRLLPRRLVPRAWWHLGGRLTVPSGPGGIENHLSEVFDTPVRVTLRVRPALRANRKPILEARGTDGPIAFVKIGDTDLTRELVAHEARTLDLLAGVPLKTVVPPAVLHHGSWRGLSVLALTPLPDGGDGFPTASSPTRSPRGGSPASPRSRSTETPPCRPRTRQTMPSEPLFGLPENPAGRGRPPGRGSPGTVT